MSPLRRARHLARLVLAGFVLALGVATLSPLVHAQAIELVCTAGGQVKAVVHTEGGAVDVGAHHLDCALCLAASAPPPLPAVAPPPPRVPALVRADARLTALPLATALPWRARAPPAAA